MPAPVRAASMADPKKPTGAHPQPTILGGIAPYDAKKGAVVSGNLMHRHL
jgi:hypothetical protein